MALWSHPGQYKRQGAQQRWPQPYPSGDCGIGARPPNAETSGLGGYADAARIRHRTLAMAQGVLLSSVEDHARSNHASTKRHAFADGAAFANNTEAARTKSKRPEKLGPSEIKATPSGPMDTNPKLPVTGKGSHTKARASESQPLLCRKLVLSLGTACFTNRGCASIMYDARGAECGRNSTVVFCNIESAHQDSELAGWVNQLRGC